MTEGLRSSPESAGEQVRDGERITQAQEQTLRRLCDGYRVAYDPQHYTEQFDLPRGYVAGFIGGPEYDGTVEGKARTLYVGVDQDGSASS